MAKKDSEEKRMPQQEAYTVSDLDQIKVLADPLRLRILEAFGEERTTKQVAEILGEKPTKLYHHVDALERVGLIRLSRTRQNRGTVEKYYLAVARTFRADSRVFQADEKARSEKTATLLQVISTIFDTTSAELSAIADQNTGMEGIEEEGIVSFLEVRASKKELKEFRDKLHALVQSLETFGAETPDAESYRLTLAYYPLVKTKRPTPKKR